MDTLDGVSAADKDFGYVLIEQWRVVASVFVGYSMCADWSRLDQLDIAKMCSFSLASAKAPVDRWPWSL